VKRNIFEGEVRRSEVEYFTIGIRPYPVDLDPLKSPNCKWVGLRVAHDRSDTLYNRIERIRDDVQLAGLVRRRKELRERESSDNRWYEIIDKIHEVGCTITGECVDTWTGKKTTRSITPIISNLSNEEEKSISLGAYGDKDPIESDLVGEYYKNQRRMSFVRRAIEHYNALITLAAILRLPEIKTGFSMPIRRMAHVNIHGLEMIFSVAEIYVKAGPDKGFTGFWKLEYMADEIEMLTV